MFLAAFDDRVLQILMAAAVVSTLLGSIPKKEREHYGYIEGVAIWIAIFIVAVVTATSVAPAVEAQDWRQREFPLAPTNSTGNFVAPYFDGFYQNEDGTYTLSFGFMNRNDSELIEIELGANNFIEPAEYDGVQPTSFPTRTSRSPSSGPR